MIGTFGGTVSSSGWATAGLACAALTPTPAAARFSHASSSAAIASGRRSPAMATIAMRRRKT